MNLLFEDMIRAETETLVCRIWRQHPPDGTNAALKQYALSLMMPDRYRDRSFIEIASLLAAIERVNSVDGVDARKGVQ